ncbi:hypothetical protein A6A19_08120 [Actinobacillus delphinicola]|uniref:hypothetical protein n=1 Tax=Actinobacillus delphinicola TaxID=51161 RepID=UPI0024432EEC|nr:hypothetical protein [Actinobacillus delphinicola]MDG6897939.1 hypothetical protein [Actinobacillus delphinicola]
MLNKLKKEQEKRQYEKQYDYISVYDVATFIENEYKLPPYQVLSVTTTLTYRIPLIGSENYISAIPCYHEEYFFDLNIVQKNYIDKSIYCWADHYYVFPGFENNLVTYWEKLKSHPSNENMSAFIQNLSDREQEALSIWNDGEWDIVGEHIHELRLLMDDDKPSFSTLNNINNLEDIMKSYYYKRSDIEQALGVKLPDTITPPLPNIDSYDVHVANTNIDDTYTEEIASLTSRITEPKKKNLELDRKLLDKLKKSVAPKSRSCYLNIILALKETLLEKKVFKNQTELETYLSDLFKGYMGFSESNLNNVFADANQLK